MKYPTTPDRRYFVVKDRLWRCTNPNLDEDARQKYVQQLMNARRQVKKFKQLNDEVALKRARSQVHQAKVALGERGPVWWEDNSSDYNRYLVKNTPYAEWYGAINKKTT